MPLETAEFIDDLNELWPTGTDPVSQGDDHLRTIKAVLQNTLLNANKQYDLSKLDDIGSAMPIITVYDVGGSQKTHVFTPGRTWYKVIVTGGGGGGTEDGDGRGRGGFAGGTAIKTAAITNSQASYKVGTGGGPEADGTDSTWSSGAVSLVGQRGKHNTFTGGSGATGGDLNLDGGGQDGVTDRGTKGGESYWGGSQMQTGRGAPGCGGRGQYDGGSTGSGQDGIIYVEEYV